MEKVEQCKSGGDHQAIFAEAANVITEQHRPMNVMKICNDCGATISVFRSETSDQLSVRVSLMKSRGE